MMDLFKARGGENTMVWFCVCSVCRKVLGSGGNAGKACAGQRHVDWNYFCSDCHPDRQNRYDK